MGNTISALEALTVMTKQESPIRALDVRSEGEFAKSSLPFSCNVPILNDERRHLVGIEYKKKGNTSATALGHELVDPIKPVLLSRWQESLARQDAPIVFCWRGGSRSQITQTWLKEQGQESLRVEGGYKALRNTLLSELQKLPKLFILSGPTGSLKTKLLLERPIPRRIDLEGLAEHRGSAFGLELGTTQPGQALFENRVLFEFFWKKQTLLLEDESRLIGHRGLPLELWDAMRVAPRIVMEVPLDERVENIVTDYVEAPTIADPAHKKPLQDYFLGALSRIQKSLGGLLYGQLTEALTSAFSGPDFHRESHHKWVRLLLDQYYDRAYEHSFRRSQKDVIFRGSTEACRQWLESEFDHS